MAWTAPATATVGQLVTASFWNAQVRDNITYLGGSAAAYVGAAEVPTGTSFAAMTTAGPVVTVTTGTKALVVMSCEFDALANPAYMSFAVSGASTIAASNDNSINFSHVAGGYTVKLGGHIYLSSLTAGSNTFTAQYAKASGSPTIGYRHLAVIPLA